MWLFMHMYKKRCVCMGGGWKPVVLYQNYLNNTSIIKFLYTLNCKNGVLKIHCQSIEPNLFRKVCKSKLGCYLPDRRVYLSLCQGSAHTDDVLIPSFEGIKHLTDILASGVTDADQASIWFDTVVAARQVFACTLTIGDHVIQLYEYPQSITPWGHLSLSLWVWKFKPVLCDLYA